MPTFVWVIIGIVVLLILVAVAIYNGLVKLSTRVDEAWSDITVQLKRRSDLIPNLVEVVKGYAKHESGVFEAVSQARASVMSAAKQGPAAAAKAEGELEHTLKSLFAVAEAYPQLQASDNFRDLQGELVDTEDKIQSARRFYNGGVRELNIKVKTFPDNIFAGIFGFHAREFFEVEDRAAIEKAPEVKL
jgi:lemA-like protein